jgi:hypothetical protein
MKSETSDFLNYARTHDGVHRYGRLYGRLRVKIPEKPYASSFTTEGGGNRLLQVVGSHLKGCHPRCVVRDSKCNVCLYVEHN